MDLEPEIQDFIAQSQSFLRPGYLKEPIGEQRRLYDALCRAYDFGRPAGLEVRGLAIPGPAGEIPARLYRKPGPRVQGGLVYFHGGSWYLGGLDSHDSITAELAERTGITVVAVDYRLAPEHHFPAAYDDALAALDWIAHSAAELAIDPARLGVGGDSAGGNLAAAVALAARDRKAPHLKAQILIYPALDRHDAAAKASPDEGVPLLEAEEITFAVRCYTGADVMPDDVRAVPLLAEDFTGLPPAAILAAEADPLLADAEAYARSLAASGVAVELELARGVVHGFLRARRMSPESGRAFAWLCDATQRLLG
ncbi:MAG: alpha/beta hydrolase [Kiloniellales bacterium]|nr:alpha/beta hydrolase [Kiloniellales bacterium]